MAQVSKSKTRPGVRTVPEDFTGCYLVVAGHISLNDPGLHGFVVPCDRRLHLVTILAVLGFRVAAQGCCESHRRLGMLPTREMWAGARHSDKHWYKCFALVAS